ncbi:MAG: hypothetical protein KC431_27800 [Myxococcales bacterium]|nr:hypothetical protein [Myxococcales bacterium]
MTMVIGVTFVLGFRSGEVEASARPQLSTRIPLDDACRRGHCIVGESTDSEGEMCCVGFRCTPYAGACDGEIVYCQDRMVDACSDGTLSEEPGRG